MKRALLYILVCFFLPSFVFADDDWNSFSGVEHAWDGQKSITNKEFEQAIDVLQAKQKQREAKNRKRLVKKVSGGGTSLHNEMAPDKEIKELTSLKKNTEGLILNVPVNMVINDVVLDKGYYKILADKDKNGEIYISFYQSQFFKGKVKAHETQDDYGQDNLDFVELIPYNDQFVKIIFGSLDFNAYTFIRYTDL